MLLIPVDVLEGEATLPALPSRPTLDPGGSASESEAKQAVEAIRSAQRPLVLAGLGAVRSGAREALVDLAEIIGAELATTLRARDLFTGHALAVGAVGGYGHELADEPAAKADVVLVFGASLNVFTTSAGRSFAGSTIVQCDIDRAALGTTTRVDVGIVGDARIVARQLVRRLGDSPPGSGARRAEREARVASWVPEPVPEAGPPFHAAAVCRALDASLPTERTVIVDAGAFTEYPMKWLRSPDPSGLVFTAGFGSVGLSLGAGIGAALGRPDRMPVVVVGDGGFMMSLPQFETAARLGVPLVVVVLDDGAYGAEIHHLRRRGRSLDAAQFSTPDLVAIATALGGDGLRLEHLSDIRVVGEQVAAGLDRPLLLHVPIDGNVVSPWFHDMVEHATRFQR